MSDGEKYLKEVREGRYHTALPRDAQDALRRAAQTPITPSEPLARAQEIEQAILWCKANYPQYFRNGKNPK